LVPLFLTASEQVHFAKNFTGLTWLCFKVKFIDQRKRRKKMKRRVPQSHCSQLVVFLCCTIVNKDDWHLENHASQILTVPTWSIPASYPTKAYEDFESYFGPLAINHVNQSFIQEQSTTEEALYEAGRLSKSTSMTLRSCVSSMERCDPVSVVSSSYPGTNLAPINANDISIVIDANQSFIQKQSQYLRKLWTKQGGSEININDLPILRIIIISPGTKGNKARQRTRIRE